MAEFIVPTNATLNAAKSFLSGSSYFDLDPPEANLIFHPKWMHMEPFALSMIAAWAGWCSQNSLRINIENLTQKVDYAWRMSLFENLPVEYHPSRIEHEEAGRFMPIKHVQTSSEARAVIADISGCFT